MKITNKNNLPEPIVNAIKNKEYQGGGFISASSASISPREYWLKRRHSNEIEADVSDMIWALFGTAVHSIIEKGEEEQGLSEAFLSAEIDGKKVTGTCDYYKDGVISDWKTDSVWTIIYGSQDESRELQLNIYAWLFQKAGFKVSELKIVSIIRDWQKSKAKYDPSYPQSQIVEKKYKLWDMEETEQYLRNKMLEIESAELLEDNDLPLCNDKYRWKDETKYAVMQKGKKRAIKLHTEKGLAEEHMRNLSIDGNSYKIEERIGEAKKCKDYCSAYAFCNQAKEDGTTSD